MNIRTRGVFRAGVIAGALLLGSGAVADETKTIKVNINPALGVDRTVDYAGLAQLGPWDDRNYKLTKDDLARLSEHESDSILPVPAFYRVEMRKANPNLPTTGPAQYPRSAVNGFVAKYGGFQLNGKTYKSVAAAGKGKYVVSNDDDDKDEGKFALNLVGGEKRITTPAGASESAIAINPVNTNLLIAGTNGPGSGQKAWRSSDGGLTWLGPVSLASTCCDPTVGWSSDGTIAYMGALSSVVGSGTNVLFYRSVDNGASWSLSATLSNQHASDKEYIHVDTYAGSPKKDNIYIAWHDSNVQRFSRSTDRGVTFSAAVTLDSGNKGIGSDITSDKNGNVYFFYPAISGGTTASKAIRVLKSTDGGATFGAGSTVSATNADFDFPIPAMETRRAFIYVSADTDKSAGSFANSIYVAWTDTNTLEDDTVAANNHSVVKVARSRDGGATWATSLAHPSADISTIDRFNQWLSVDSSGRVFVMYYDTRNSSGRSGTDIYYVVSTDGGVTFGTPTRLTTKTSKNINDVNEWGDYNGMDAIGAELMAIYTDNRDETGGTAESIDVYGIGFSGGTPANVPPVANFSFTTSTLTANFTDSSTDSDGTIASRSWNFGDSSSSTTASPSHTYAAAGTYSVTLTVTDNQGATNAVTKSVTVSAANTPPTANFTFTTSGLTATFTDASTDAGGSIASRSWNFGDSTTSTATNPSHTYAAAGTYTVTETVTDNGGLTASTSKSVTVTAPSNVPPVANFSFTTSGLTATFTDSSTDSDGTIASRSWNFGDSTSSTVASPSHTYAAAGTYTVTLTVTDNLGATNTKSSSVTVSTGNVLTNGVGVTIASATVGQQLNYTIAIPSGATNLVVSISGGTGDADLYTRAAGAPTTTTYDCRPFASGNAESCTVAAPAAGTFYVMVNTYAAYSGVTLKATWTIAGPSTQLLANTSFESGISTWTQSGTTVITNSTSRTAKTGTWYAWLGGNGTTTTETLTQSVAIPAGKASASLAYNVKIDTAETTTATQYDKFTAAIVNSAGTVLKTCTSLSNLNKGTAYVAYTCDATAYIGQTVSVKFTATEDSSLQTSFLVDDVTLTVN